MEHVVTPGESLWSISLHYYGSGDLYHRLVSANPQTITDPNVIHPGDIIRVREPECSRPHYSRSNGVSSYIRVTVPAAMVLTKIRLGSLIVRLRSIPARGH